MKENNERIDGKSKSKVKRPLILAMYLVLGIVLSVIVFYSWKVYHTANKIQEKVTETTKRKKKVNISEDTPQKNPDPISILLLGVDTRPGDKGRSDTMVIVTINPITKSTKLVSIPRDARVKIPGKSGYHKINAAYAYGGPDLAMRTVEEEFDIPIDYFISMNFDGLKSLVDVAGGVTIQNTFAFSDGGYDFPEGEITLDGSAALTYCRMRKKDPRGDYGRMERQRNVIVAVVGKVSKFSSVSKLNTILDAVGENVRTNLSVGQMWDVKSNYSTAHENVASDYVKGVGAMINGGSYQLILHNEKLRVINLLRENLGLQVKDPGFYPNVDVEIKSGS
jgi:LCP family protein required for cell wall assembly